MLFLRLSNRNASILSVGVVYVINSMDFHTEYQISSLSHGNALKLVLTKVRVNCTWTFHQPYRAVKADLQYLALRPEVNINVRQTQE